MPRTHEPDPTSPRSPAPTCPACGNGMRLVLSTPSDRYINLDECLYRCSCGEEANYMMARKD